MNCVLYLFLFTRISKSVRSRAWLTVDRDRAATRRRPCSFDCDFIISSYYTRNCFAHSRPALGRRRQSWSPGRCRRWTRDPQDEHVPGGPGCHEVRPWLRDDATTGLTPCPSASRSRKMIPPSSSVRMSRSEVSSGALWVWLKSSVCAMVLRHLGHG